MIVNSGPVDVAGHYDELDIFYRRLWGEHLHHGLWLTGREDVATATLQMLQRVARPLNLSPGDRVADVGCGYGAGAHWLAETTGADVIGYTVSARQQQIARARQPARGHLRVIRGDWLQNDLPDQSLDAVISIECLAHIADKGGFFRQVHRTLRPGATASITAWLSADAPSPAARRRLLQPICDEGQLPSLGSAREYARMAEWNGLRVVQVQDATRRVRRTWLLSVRRMLDAVLRCAEARRYLLSAASRQRRFALSVPRLLAGQVLGPMRYGLLVLQRR